MYLHIHNTLFLRDQSISTCKHDTLFRVSHNIMGIVTFLRVCQSMRSVTLFRVCHNIMGIVTLLRVCQTMTGLSHYLGYVTVSWVLSHY